MIYVGTSGFSYRDWIGPFYPEGMRQADMLSFYCAQFPVVELDFTYYRMPGARTIGGIERKTPSGYRIIVKAHRSMTHELPPAAAGGVGAAANAFRMAMEPLVAAGKLSCVLAQYPYKLARGEDGMGQILALQEALAGIPLVVEFRNRTWVSEDTFAWLRRAGLGFCCVDEPRLRGLMPPLAVATSNLAYIRFHGRNAAKWWKHSEAWERYDYLYTEAELTEWVPRIRAVSARTAETYVLFNNCHAGQAARNARLMKALLEED